MNDLKSIIEDVNKSDIISKKVIEKVIEKIGWEEWQDLYEEYTDIRTTTGEVVITLRNSESLEQENEQLKQQIEKMINCWNCAHYKVGDTTCFKGKPHNSSGCLKDWVLRMEDK